MYCKQPQPKPLAVAVFVALAAMSAFPAFAQDAAPAKQEEAKTLDTLVVTAQKREEALQDVPIAVTVLSQEALQDAGVRDIKDLQTLVPGLTVTSTQSEAITTARIRGVGTVGDNVGLESSVGVVIDGVYRPRNSVGFGDLGELERIEVLKGPQGTLFGKNTSAGVINVVTKRPDFVRSGDFELTAGTPGALGFAGSFNMPVGENNAFRIYAAKRTRDGFMDVHTGAGSSREDYDQSFHSVRAQWRFTPSDAWDINFTADYTKRDENCCTAVTTVRGLTADIVDRLAADEGVTRVADPEARQAWSNRGTEQHIKDKGLSAEINWDTPWLGGATLTSITAARDWETVNGLDFDYSTADILYRSADRDESLSRFKQFSQEFRLTGSTDRVDWMVGMFYANEDIERNESYRIGKDYGAYLSSAILTTINPAFRNAPSSNSFIQEVVASNLANLPPYSAIFGDLAALDHYDQNAKSIALFTNNSFHVTDAFDITLGLRYTKEDKELDSLYSNPSGGGACGTLLTLAQTSPATLAGRIGAALTRRGVPFALLPAQTQQTIVSNVVGYSCLPWVNPLHNVNAPDPRVRDTHQERSEKEWSGTLKFAWRMNDNAMFYLSGARGYKAGGFNLDRVQSSNGLSSGGAGVLPVLDTSFPGEFVDSYELGTKTTWAGGNLLLNATLFHQTYSDFQLNSFLGTSFVVRSIPEVTSRGIDAEILWQAASFKGLMLQSGVTYAKTEYGDTIPGGDFINPTGALYKLPGAQVSFAPELSVSGAVTYEWALDEGVLARFNIGAKYMSEFNTGSDLDPEKMQDAYTVVNARIGIGASDRSWSLELWGLNIFDKYYTQVGFDAPLQNLSPAPNNPVNSFNAFPGAPATYGITYRKRF